MKLLIVNGAQACKIVQLKIICMNKYVGEMYSICVHICNVWRRKCEVFPMLIRNMDDLETENTHRARDGESKAHIAFRMLILLFHLTL